MTELTNIKQVADFECKLLLENVFFFKKKIICRRLRLDIVYIRDVTWKQSNKSEWKRFGLLK